MQCFSIEILLYTSRIVVKSQAKLWTPVPPCFHIKVCVSLLLLNLRNSNNGEDFYCEKLLYFRKTGFS